jgi:putative transcriptional regulator
MKKQNATKRNLFAELMEGVEAMKGQREGKVTLRTYAVPVPKVKESPGSEFFVAAREQFNVSRAVWANMLRVSPRTVEKWEQGGQVSALAATFVELVTRYPDTIERLRTLPRRVTRTSRRMQRTGTARSSATQARSGGRTGNGPSRRRRSAGVS